MIYAKNSAPVAMYETVTMYEMEICSRENSHHQINYHYTALVRSAISALAEFLLLYLKRRFVITLTGIL